MNHQEVAARRQAIAAAFSARLKFLDGNELLLPEDTPPGIAMLYPIKVPHPLDFIAYMDMYDIECVALPGGYVGLPFYSTITDFEVRYIAETAAICAVLAQ